MKKLIALILVLIACFTLCSCGSADYDNRTLHFSEPLDFLNEDFRWDMTINETEEFLRKIYPDIPINPEVKDYDDYTMMYIQTPASDDIIFRYNANREMEFVKYMMEGDERSFANLVDKAISEYGDYDEKSKNGLYTWYGTMNGSPIKMTMSHDLNYGGYQVKPVK